jgi:hypothetical protein
MSLFNPLLVIGVGTLVGASAVIAFNVIRSRRATKQQSRRDQLMALARRTGLDYVGERPRAEDAEAAAWYRCGTRDVTVDGFLQGQDQHGRYWMARREVDGQTQEVFGFQIRGDLNTGDLYFEPAIAGARRGGTSWARRLVTGKPASPSCSVARWTIHRQATAEQLLDDQARNSINQWARRLVARGKVEGRVPVGLEISDGRGWIYTPLPLDGPRTRDFLELALDLRSAVTHEIRCRPATISTRVNTVSAESDRRGRQNTQPLFAVDAAEGADLGDESKTVVLSAQELLRDVPAPSRTKKIRKFEIPEPEEEVEVLWTHS